MELENQEMMTKGEIEIEKEKEKEKGTEKEYWHVLDDCLASMFYDSICHIVSCAIHQYNM